MCDRIVSEPLFFCFLKQGTEVPEAESHSVSIIFSSPLPESDPKRSSYSFFFFNAVRQSHFGISLQLRYGLHREKEERVRCRAEDRARKGCRGGPCWRFCREQRVSTGTEIRKDQDTEITAQTIPSRGHAEQGSTFSNTYTDTTTTDTDKHTSTTTSARDDGVATQVSSTTSATTTPSSSSYHSHQTPKQQIADDTETTPTGTGPSEQGRTSFCRRTTGVIGSPYFQDTDTTTTTTESSSVECDRARSISTIFPNATECCSAVQRGGPTTRQGIPTDCRYAGSKRKG